MYDKNIEKTNDLCVDIGSIIGCGSTPKGWEFAIPDSYMVNINIPQHRGFESHLIVDKMTVAPLLLLSRYMVWSV